MHIRSRLFGETDIDDEKVIEFTQGMMGFEEYKKYAIIFDSERENAGGIMWLQSLEDEDIAFPVVNPMDIKPDYNPIVEDEWLESLGDFGEDENLFVLLVLTVPSDLTKTTCNMKAPVIINTLTRKACQLIVNNEDYLVKYNIYDYIEKLKKEG